MKKILSYLLIAIIAIATFIPSVKAAANNGIITINHAVKGETYSYYRILDLESYSGNAYAYKINEDWKSIFTKTEDGEVVLNDNFAPYFTLNVEGSNYYVSWKGDNSTARATALAEILRGLATKPAATGTITADETGKAEVTGLALGYYFVESSVGVICSLNTTNNQAVIEEKNATPSIDKVITNQGKVNSASIGEDVPYTVTITNIGGLKNVTVKDTFTEGLTFNNDVLVKIGETKVAEENYTITLDGQSFTIEFDNAYIASLAKTTTLVITYSAKVNVNSITNEPNTNDAELTYGNNSKVESTPVSTYTYAFKFHKTDGTNPLTGAEFKLYDARGNEIKVVKNTENSTDSINYYRVATANETGVVMEAGVVIVEGLKAGTYSLEETKAPEGYNKLASRISISITGNTDTAKFSLMDKEIVNTTGIVLPSTGGMGTTLFVAIGTLLILGFGVTLITKYRMAKEY